MSATRPGVNSAHEQIVEMSRTNFPLLQIRQLSIMVMRHRWRPVDNGVLLASSGLNEILTPISPWMNGGKYECLLAFAKRATVRCGHAHSVAPW